MRVAILSPIAWRTPPRHYGPWERVVSLITEGLVEKGIDVTLFATSDSITNAKLNSVCESGYEENEEILPKVWECLHISEIFENASQFDLIHNNFDYLPLSYSRLVTTPVLTTIHGFSSEKILPVFKKYNSGSAYVSISNADRSPELDYIATVYHGIDLENFSYNDSPDDYLLYFSRIHPEKGCWEAIEIAKKTGNKLIMAGIIQDRHYFDDKVKPNIDDENITYVGSVGPEKRDSLLKSAKALLHPISFEEPFGLSVIESMACGTPVIAFPLGSMPEIIEDKKNGFLVNNIDEACDAVKMIDKIDRKFCLETVQNKFSAERMVNNYIDVYKKILKSVY